ncbi:methyl-accepting chemotaxis protein [Rhizobium sp. LC145]|uniref:methyl-accepting chemotaxis protein n=1 Tax=Rhizobium sp. LC145 TaxID=1120688 RepID=UPI00062A3891|nr:methyl-accepting chemotaxis protein [Rhizobium sp. LC145]KKX30406.1 hypothetical protein YH62_12780 [Rhizobium sp. LC145]TKT46467.1 methyl-accepting chemotaxis protein [Rhizobiaceae bacterium LC148]
MLKDRENIEIEVQNLRSVVSALDAGLRSLASGDLSHVIETPFPRAYEGLRNDFNRSLRMIAGSMEAVAERSDLLRDASYNLRQELEGRADAAAAQASMLTKAFAEASELALTAGRQKTQAEHAGAIAHNARLDMREPRQACEASLAALGNAEEATLDLTPLVAAIEQTAGEAGKLASKAGNEANGKELRALAEGLAATAGMLSAAVAGSAQAATLARDRAERTGREIAAISLYVDALDEHVRDLATGAVIEADAASALQADLSELARASRQGNAGEHALRMILDRMDREIAAIGQQAGRYIPVTVLTPQPPTPSRPGTHLRLVKS